MGGGDFQRCARAERRIDGGLIAARVMRDGDRAARGRENASGRSDRAATRVRGEREDRRSETRAPDARLRVLLATDDGDTRALVEPMLDELGVEVVVATNGNEVVDALRGRVRGGKGSAADGSVDMILLDVLMPELDGEVELVEACKSNEALRGVPIVILSTVEQRKACETLYESSGAAGFLTKPVNRTELKESLSHTRAMMKSNESGSAEGSGNDQNEQQNVVGSAKSSLTKLTNREKAAGGSGSGGGSGQGQNDSGSDNVCNEKSRRREAEAMDRWASREGGSGDCGSGGSGQGTGSGSGSHEGSGSGQRDPNENEKFRGLSVQLIKAHGGATTMLELSLPEHTSEHVVVRRSNSRSAFKGFQNYLKNEKKETEVQMMSLDLTRQHQSFYEASSMMPAADFAKFYGPIIPPGMPPPSMDLPMPPPPYVDMNQWAAAAVAAATMQQEIIETSYGANPFWSVLQNAADHTQQTSSSQAAEHRAEAIRRFLKKRKERNFDKKVRYASRQQLAASRPRVRGQFIRNAEDTTTTNGSNGSDGKKSNESNASAAKGDGEVEGHEEEYVDRHGSNAGTSNDGSNEGSKEGSRSSSRDGSK